MSRWVPIGCALVLLSARPAAAQGRILQGRAEGAPVGIAVPEYGVAAAEQPTSLEVNPAGIGFVDGAALQYFHEGRGDTGQAADGFWLAGAVGPVVPALSMQWVRPADGGGARFRKTTLGLALTPGGVFSVAGALNWYSSPARDLDRLSTVDVGVTARPWRHLSVAAAVLGIDGSLDGRALPIQGSLGIATRWWDDRLTLSADLLGDDRAREAFAVTAGALGVGAEVGGGFAVRAQVQLPLRDAAGPAGSTYGQLALTYDTPHAGVTTALGGGAGAAGTWLVGARLSTRAYRAAAPSAVPLIDLSHDLARRPSFLGDTTDAYGALLRRLRAVADDPAVPALAVKIDQLPVGHGRVDELRRLLLEVKARRPVVAYLTGGGMKEYYLASAATSVLMPPSAELRASGLSSSTLFLREPLSRVGVAFDVVAIGAYKNAPDPLVRRDMSEAQREVTASILDDVFGREVHAIAQARGLSEARVRELVDAGAFSSEQAVAARLVDGTAWPDELDGLVSARIGRDVRTAPASDPPRLRGSQRWGPRSRVAVVRVEGAIAQGKSRSDPLGALEIAGSETVAALLRDAAHDPRVVAVVVRLESPGGDAVASDLLWREVMQTRRAGKQVIASMGDMAASGGYLVATAADAVVAEPSTLTGSIGVFAIKPDVSRLLDKIGARVVTTRRGQHADLQSITRPWTGEERELVRNQVRAFYDLFLARVAQGRDKTVEEVERLARGRVWTGAQALERGLVDELGSLDDAVRIACERSGHAREDVEIVPYEPRRPLLSGLLAGLGAEAEPSALRVLAAVPVLSTLAAFLEMGSMVALPPEWIGPPAGSAPPGG